MADDELKALIQSNAKAIQALTEVLNEAIRAIAALAQTSAAHERVADLLDIS